MQGVVVIAGHWNDPSTCAEALPDGWLWTGDVGRLDDQSSLNLLDRSKDRVVSGGSAKPTTPQRANRTEACRAGPAQCRPPVLRSILPTRHHRRAMSLPPPLTALHDLDAQLAGSGYAVLDPASLARLAGVHADSMAAWQTHWDEMPADRYLLDGGRYRRRRHGCFIVEPDGGVRAVPNRAHWQPVEYNALHGGLERWFEPMAPAIAADPAWARLLAALAARAATLRGDPGARWHVEAHPFRIDTTDGIGRPTPEGAHRDGVDLVVVVLVARQGIKGGETRVFDARGPQGMRFTLADAWSALLLDDERVIHETTPIQPLEPGSNGHRDTLVLTFRSAGFQGPAAAS